MPRRLAYRSITVPNWIAVALALLLFAIAMALAWWRIDTYDSASARADAAGGQVVVRLNR